MRNHVGALFEAVEKVATREADKQRPLLVRLENRLKSKLKPNTIRTGIENVLKEYEERAAKNKVITHFLMNALCTSLQSV
ncbi:hypothetical protein ACT7DH_12255 [Bacillus pacificus]